MGVPKAVIGVEHARMYLTVVGAEVIWRTLLVVFVPGTRKQMRPVEARVENLHLLLAGALNVDAVKDAVPGVG